MFELQVYVDMQKIERYPHKIEELYESIKKKAAAASKVRHLGHVILYYMMAIL